MSEETTEAAVEAATEAAMQGYAEEATEGATCFFRGSINRRSNVCRCGISEGGGEHNNQSVDD